MTLIEGIGDEVVHFFIALLVVTVVTIAWWTTSISEQRHVQTVWLLDRRRHRAHRRLTNHTQTVTITEGTTSHTTALDGPDISVETIEANPKPPEAGTSTSDTSSTEERSEEEEQTRIVETMDADASVLRQRRLAFYNRTIVQDGSASNSNSESSGQDTPIMEHNYAEKASNPINPDNSSNNQNTNSESPRNSADIRIKLKYINDDLKLVGGKLSEQLGDFKKRHFQVELSSNKLVRLIFNGQVLHQDTKTLEDCGMFDNCVVHCLIHQKRPSPGDENLSDSRRENSSNHNRNSPQNQGRDWDLGNFLFAIISFGLLSAWYCRYVYPHLYNVTASVGLILMTVIFSIVLFGTYFPDQDRLAQRMDNAATVQT